MFETCDIAGSWPEEENNGKKLPTMCGPRMIYTQIDILSNPAVVICLENMNFMHVFTSFI